MEDSATVSRIVHADREPSILRNLADIVTNVTVPWFLTHLMGFYSSRHLADHVPLHERFAP